MPADEAKAELAEAMPALQAAIDSLKALNKNDIVEIKSFLNFVLSAALSTISELFVVEVKHDFCRAEAMTMSMAVSIQWTSLPKAMMSPGRDLSFLK